MMIISAHQRGRVIREQEGCEVGRIIGWDMLSTPHCVSPHTA